MTLIKIFLLIIISILVIGCGETSNFTPNTKNNLKSLAYEKAMQTTKEEILNTINKARSVARDCHDGQGLVPPAPALSWNNELYASAYEHSYDLATSNTFSHYGSGTLSDTTGSNNGKKSYFIDRIEANGYSNYRIIGENIAGGHTTIKATVNAWITSPAHCANLMNSKFTEVGVAVAVDESSEYGIYWTQNFGSKK